MEGRELDDGIATSPAVGHRPGSGKKWPFFFKRVHTVCRYLLLMRIGKDQITGPPAWRLKRALAFIELNLHAPIRLPVMAQSVGLSRMHFARLFRKSTGLCPMSICCKEESDAPKIYCFIPMIP
jgi:hypothetical protein